jgi:hypothetical protein
MGRAMHVDIQPFKKARDRDGGHGFVSNGWMMHTAGRVRATASHDRLDNIVHRINGSVN